MLHNFIDLVSVTHPPTNYLFTSPYSDGGPPSAFGWGGVRVWYLTKKHTSVRRWLHGCIMSPVSAINSMSALTLYISA